MHTMHKVHMENENWNRRGDAVLEYPELIILGSTGSVGEQAVDVARAHGIRVRGVTAHRSVARVEEKERLFD